MEITNEINKHIFRGYDIRGVYEKDIDVNVAYTLGKSFGTYIKRFNKKQCVVGRDNRQSSPELSDALIKGILDTGIDVYNIGLVTTPMYYFACMSLDIPSGMMVTASHNPKDDNGFKFAFDERGNARGEMIEEFRDFTFAGRFDFGTGTLRNVDIKKQYIDFFHSSLDFGDRKVKVVLDLGNGTTSCVASELFSQFPVETDIIFGESDSTFPNHHPDPCVEANLKDLKEKVKEYKADLGIGFDGDGDRIGVVDEKGNYIATDKLMIIIIRDIVDIVDKKEFLYDVKCSKSLSDEIEKLGAKGICFRTGNSYTKSKVLEDDIPFGGELSGHIYFNDRWPGFDSALYVALRVIEILSKTNKNLSELLEGINEYHSTEEIKFESSDENKAAVVEKIKAYCKKKKYKTIELDGVRANFDDGWALVRYSNTGPNITARFEAETKTRLKELEKEFSDLIKEYNK